MFTICPECFRQYRVHAEQLTAANGQVRCGHCGKQFNAMEALTDEPILFAGPKKESVADTPVNSSPIIDDDKDGFEQEPQFDIPTGGLAMESPPLPGDPEELDNVPELPDDLILEDLPENLQEEPPPPAGKNKLWWSLGVLLVFLVLVLQLTWFNRDTLLQHYPQLRPLARQLCEHFDCEFYRYREISSIKILNRDVRVHPNIEGALLVNATMANQSAKVQPFPEIQFSLFDTNGLMLASRQFGPDEYLDKSIAVDEGMLPEQPVHFVLEVTGPVEGAVSFEFRFL